MSSASSPRKQPVSGTTTPILSQALQTPASRQSTTTTTTPTSATKRTPIIRPKPAEAPKPLNPGVIDLTDEDDRASKPGTAASVKILANKQMVTTPKLVAAKPLGKSPNNQTKVVNINQIKAGQVVNKGEY